jgi:hypothetical protein
MIMSAPIAIAGINVATAITVTGGEYSIDGAAYTSSAGTVTAGSAVTLRVTAASTPGGTAQASLTVGGVSATFRVTTSDDVTAPTATIAFPPPVARTGAASITVRGSAADASGPLAAVHVNGVLATTANGFATWTAVVPLAVGENTLTLTAEDSFLNVENAAAQVVVQRNARLGSPGSLALDAPNNRAFVIDGAADALVAVDLLTGLRTWFADTAVPGNNRKDALPLAVVNDAPRNRLLLLDGYDEAIVAINLVTKQRDVLSSRHTNGGVNRFESPADLALDLTHDRVLVSRSSPPGIIAVSLTTGARTVLSDATTPNAANLFGQPRALALDLNHDRVLVTDPTTNTIYGVSLTDGARSILSDNLTPNAVEPFQNVLTMEVDTAGNRALVPQFSGRVLAVDLASGQRTVYSPGSFGTQLIFDVADLAVDVVGSRVLVLDRYARGLAAIGLANGAQTIVSPNNALSGGVGLIQPTSMILDSPNARLLVADEALHAVVGIDLASAVGSTVVDGNTGLARFASPTALVLDSAANRLFFLESGRVVSFPAAVLSVDLTTGARFILSGPALPNGVLPLTTPMEMALDSPRTRLLVTERDPKDVKAVDTGSGLRSIVSSDTVPNALNPFATPLGILVDGVSDRGLVASSGFGIGSSVLAMNLATGARSAVAANTVTMPGPKLLALDAVRNRVLVADELRQALLAFDLTSGAIGALTDLNDPDNPIDAPYGIAFDPAKQIAYLVESNFAAVLAVDLVTGRHVYLAH